MAFQFPSNPVLDQTYSPMAGTIYSYDGTGWVLVGRAAEDSANFVQRFGDTMTGPLLHPDGTVAAPSIAFAAELGTGFTRSGVGTILGTSNGAVVWGWTPTQFNMANGVTFGGQAATFAGAVTASSTLGVSGWATFGSGLTANSSIYLPVSGSVHGRNYQNDAWWVGLHMGGDNRLYLAYSGYPETIINASGVNRLHVHGSGTTFTGLIYGNLSGAAARLYTRGDTASTAMAFHWAGQTADQPNWIWGGRDSDPANMYVWQPALLNVNYANRAFNSHRVHLNADNAQAAVTFWWDGQGGQPTWIWGVPDQSNTRLYNPANFSVNYANSTNISSYVTAHGYGQMGFHWSVQSSPHYVWGNYSDGNTYLMTPGSMSVNYANSAGSAGSTGTINGATGGAVNGRIEANRDGWGGGNADGAWHAGQFLAQCTGGAYPLIGWHRSGSIAWSVTIYYDGSLWFGSSANGGPSGLSSWCSRIGQNGAWTSLAYNTTSLILRDAEPLTGSLVNVLSLRGVRGYNEETKRPGIALMAEDIERVFPELVSEDEEIEGHPRVKGYNQTLLIAPIIEAIRELNERLTALENAI